MLRHSKYLCDSPVRSAIMKFKLNCQWEVEDSIIKSMIVQHEDEISSETDTLLEKELAEDQSVILKPFLNTLIKTLKIP